MAKVFISHSTDLIAAARLKELLSKIGHISWLDDIPPSGVIEQKIDDAIKACDCMVVLLSNNSIDSDWVRYEIHRKIQVDGHEQNIVLVHLDNCAIPARLMTIKHIDFAEDYSNGLMELVAFIAERSLIPRSVPQHLQSVTQPHLPDRSKITVVIPCGGTGLKLFPMTLVMPKCLVIIDKKTILQHIFDSFLNYKHIFSEVIVTTNVDRGGKKYYHDAIEENIRQGGYGEFVKCIQHESQSVPHSLILLKKDDKICTDRFMLHYNDILVPKINWSNVIEQYDLDASFHHQIGTLLCSDFYPLSIGVMKKDDLGYLGEFKEKPDHSLGAQYANIAIAIFETRIIDEYCKWEIGNLDAQQKSFFQDTLKEIKRNNRVRLHEVPRWFHLQDWNALYDLQHDPKYSQLFR